jgi:hypothetical protein
MPASPEPDSSLEDGAEQRPIRPVGTWVVAGFLVLATLAMWTLVAVIFQARS